MATYSILEWQNERSLTNYPLSGEFEIPGLFVDANFIQFDGHVPVLNYVKINNANFLISITFDKETVIYNLPVNYTNKYLDLYSSDEARYLGKLVFGTATQNLSALYAGRTIYANTPFSATTVKSIPSSAGVFSLDGIFGDVKFGKTDTDTSVFYNESLTLNSLTFNAVNHHTLIDGRQPITQINEVEPVSNNITISGNDVIKVEPFNETALKISLIGTISGLSLKIPTLTS